MSKDRWLDYLFTLAVRFTGGGILGIIVSLPVLFFAGTKTRLRKTSLLVEWLNAGKHMELILWFGGCAVVGGLIAVLTTPRWKTPWYKGYHGEDDPGAFF